MTEEKRRRGRPPKLEIDEDLLKQVKALAGRGLQRKQISAALGISESLRCRLMNDEPEFKQALEEGEAQGIAQVTAYLVQAARMGNVTAMIFYLKNRDPANWQDRRHYDINPPRQPIEIDAEMTPQEAADTYADTLRNGATNVVPITKQS